MVSRRSRGYKEKNFMASFGQFILPLAVIMAIALLYFSMKLFFLTPSERRARVTDNPQTVSADTTQNAIVPPVLEKPQASAPTSPPPAVVVAGPVTQSQPSARTEPANQARPAEQPLKPTGTAQQAGGSRRYDVQIGAFTSSGNAAQLVQKARGQGYDVYISEGVQNGATYFRVRVKGSAQRAEAQDLSVKLQAQDYPVYIVPITD